MHGGNARADRRGRVPGHDQRRPDKRPPALSRHRATDESPHEMPCDACSFRFTPPLQRTNERSRLLDRQQQAPPRSQPVAKSPGATG